MNSIWIASIILQWCAIGALSLLVLSLIRQLGELSLRLNGMKEQDEVLKPYSEVPLHVVPLVDGRHFEFGGTQQAEASLVLFFSPTCGACEGLPSAVKEFRAKMDGVNLLVVLPLDHQEAKKFVAEKGLKSVAVAAQEDFPEHFVPKHGVPFAFSIAIGGKVAARGRPKEIDHLVEMAEAAVSMADMTPSHSRRKHEWGESAVYWETGAEK